MMERIRIVALSEVKPGAGIAIDDVRDKIKIMPDEDAQFLVKTGIIKNGYINLKNGYIRDNYKRLRCDTVIKL